MINIKHFYKIPSCFISRACSTARTTEKVQGFKEKPNELEVNADFIGPPDKQSNIRPVVRHIPQNETDLQKRLRLRRVEVYGWVDKFWRNHNERFFQEKDDFIAKTLKQQAPGGQGNVTADKMSEFYKAFLDKNWKLHMLFNLSWYLKNFELLFLAIQVNLEAAVRKARGK